MRLIWLGLLILCLGIEKGYAEKRIIRVGHFPTITHAQGVIGHYSTDQDKHKGWFEERLGPDVEVQWFVYNAGPSAMEAILIQALDLTYVGPNPTINAFIRSEKEALRVISGSCSGGSALVVHKDGDIHSTQDFKGKKVGTPQLGNTQDVAARAWLQAQGLKVTLTGGDVHVIPTQNADQLPLFQTKQLDAVWTVEPWVSTLILKGGGRIYLEESSLWPQTQGRYVTTHLVSSKSFLQEQPDLVEKWIAAHVELTEWIRTHSQEAQQKTQAALEAFTKNSLGKEVIERAWKQLEFTYDPIKLSLFKVAEEAYNVGLVRQKPDIEGIYELHILQKVIKQRHLKPIE